MDLPSKERRIPSGTRSQKRDETTALQLQWEKGLSPAIAAAKAVSDPATRLILAMRYWQKDGLAFHGSLFAETFSDLWPSKMDVDLTEVPPRWDSNVVAKWIVPRANSLCGVNLYRHRKKYVGSIRTEAFYNHGWNYRVSGIGPWVNENLEHPGYCRNVVVSGQGIIRDHISDGSYISLPGLVQLGQLFDVKHRAMVVMPPYIPWRERARAL